MAVVLHAPGYVHLRVDEKVLNIPGGPLIGGDLAGLDWERGYPAPGRSDLEIGGTRLRCNRHEERK
ncbi:MAG TPA: hypothetical protein VFG59_16645 [Anaeromyxobacter sp.]|nr:hypothetical protein [Anaeromyxobacter sp.]